MTEEQRWMERREKDREKKPDRNKGEVMGKDEKIKPYLVHNLYITKADGRRIIESNQFLIS